MKRYAKCIWCEQLLDSRMFRGAEGKRRACVSCVAKLRRGHVPTRKEIHAEPEIPALDPAIAAQLRAHRDDAQGVQ